MGVRIIKPEGEDGPTFKEWYCDKCKRRLDTESHGYPIGYLITKLIDLSKKYACSKECAIAQI